MPAQNLMPIRIGFDMDGVLADFEAAYHDVEVRVFGPESVTRANDPEREEEAEQAGLTEALAAADAATAGTTTDTSTQAAQDAGAKPPFDSSGSGGAPVEGSDAKAGKGTPDRASRRQARRRRDAIWAAIRATPDFWTTLKPLDKRAVKRIHALMLQHRWEVFFITQRPATEGDTVQRQTQRWLVQQGFDLPSVLVIGGSRGAAAGALRLTYHVDDSAQNCIDIISESRAKPILIVPGTDDATVTNAKKLGIGTAASIGECLDILEQATTARAQPGLLGRLASLVGWK